MSILVNEGGPTTATSFTTNGLASAGFIQMAAQSVDPTTPTAGNLKTFADSAARVSWTGPPGFKSTIDTTAITDARVWSLPDSSGMILTDTSVATVTNKTILSATNVVDATRLRTVPLAGIPANNDVLRFDSGTVQWTPMTISGTAPITYSAGTIGAAVGSTAGTVAAGNDGRLSTPQIVRVKNSNPGAGEFTSIKSAVDSILDSSAIKPYIVLIGPGVYTEAAIVVPQFVAVAGYELGTVIVHPTTNLITQFTMSANTELSQVSLVGLNGTVDRGILIESAANVFVRGLAASSFNTLILVRSPTSVTDAFIFDSYMTPPFVRGIHLDGLAATGAFGVTVRIFDTAISGDASTAQVVRIEGPFALVSLTTVGIGAATAGTGLYIADGSEVDVTGCRMRGNLLGLENPVGGAGAVIRVKSTTFRSSAVTIANVATSCTFDGVAERTQVSVASPNTTTRYMDQVGGGSIMTGALYYGPATTVPEEVGTNWVGAATLGALDGGVVTFATGLTVHITAGTGYVTSGSFPTEQLRKITWPATNLVMVASTTTYIYVTISGLATSLSIPNPLTSILLARVRTFSASVEFVDTQLNNAIHPSNEHKEFARDVLHPLYGAGSIVTANASRQLAISGGNYYWLDNQFDPVGLASPAQWLAYFHTAGVFTQALETVVSNTQYDNGTNLVSIPAGQFVKHALYIVGQGANEQYFLVYSQATFASLAAAQAGARPTPPNYFDQGVFVIAALITQQGVAGVADIMDLRPMISGSSSGASFGVTDHGNLTGLADDDHLQYILVNGTRAFSGNIDIGGFDITNVNLVDGVDVSAHASRHLPAGADPITTAAPSANLTSASTNAVGVANSLSRSDHSHAIDITGFSVASLGGILTVPHGGTGVATLGTGNFLTGNGVSPVVSTKVVPAGVVVGDTDVQTLTNKTIIGGTAGNDIAANKALAVVLNVAAPTAGQALIASDATNAAWTNISDTNFTGVLTVPHGGTGVATITSGNFVIGAGISPVTSAKVAPAGVVVGDTDVQTFTNKTIAGGVTGNDVAANKILAVSVIATPPVANQVLTATSATTAVWGDVTDAIFTGVLTVPHGGTGVATLTSGNFLVGAGVGAVTTAKVAPSGVVVGTTDAQTLTNKTVIGGTSGNDIAANKALAVVLNPAAPTAGQALIASDATNAAWTSISDTNFTGVLTVPHGGTGVATLGSGNFLVGAGTGAVVSTKVVPAGTVVGNTDSQTLTNKTILSATNVVDATRLQTFNISTTAPTNAQILAYNSGTVQWEPVGNTSTGALASQRWTVHDVKAVGVNAGTFTSGAWQTRTLSTLGGSADVSVTLAANQITFTAGTYFITVEVPAYRCDMHKARLQNITGATTIAYGSSAHTSSTTTSISYINVRATFAGVTAVEVQHQCTMTRATNGFGVATGLAGTNEIYTAVTIEKLN